MATVLISRENDRKKNELTQLRHEVEEACTQKAFFKSREQLIRLENILRHYSTLYELEDRYFDMLFYMKQKIFSLNETKGVQESMLDLLKSLEIDIKYLSKM